jgi:hypothetical protein
MKRIISLAFVMLFCGSSWAYHSSIIGGMRDGLALGMKVEEISLGSVSLNFDVQATSGEDLSFAGDNPFVLSGAAKFDFAEIGPRKIPTSLELGLVGYFGNRTEQGTYLAMIFDKIYGVDPLSLEMGFDYFGDHGHVTLQLGYDIATNP